MTRRKNSSKDKRRARVKAKRKAQQVEQALALRVADGADGVRVVSKERSDAVKAAAWAVRQASSAYDVMQSML